MRTGTSVVVPSATENRIGCGKGSGTTASPAALKRSWYSPGVTDENEKRPLASGDDRRPVCRPRPFIRMSVPRPGCGTPASDDTRPATFPVAEGATIPLSSPVEPPHALTPATATPAPAVPRLTRKSRLDIARERSCAHCCFDIGRFDGSTPFACITRLLEHERRGRAGLRPAPDEHGVDWDRYEMLGQVP